MHSLFQNLIETYSGPKVAIVACGAGVGLGQLAIMPGASKVLSSFYSPYEIDDTKLFIDNFDEAHDFGEQCVSAQSSQIIHRALLRKTSAKITIAITGALTSMRWRRGNNHAFITLNNGKDYTTHHLVLTKTTESVHQSSTYKDLYMNRKKEDDAISITSLILAGMINQELPAGVSLTCLV